MNPSRTKPPNQWKAGQSGNLKGRPPGVSAITRLRQSLSDHVPEIMDRLVVAAKGGDVQAMRLVLERVLPSLKPSEATQVIDLPTGSLADQGRAVLAAVAAGNLSTGQGAALLGAVGTMAKLVETDELAKLRIPVIVTADSGRS